MVSLQPVTQSYIEEPESCFLVTQKKYKKNSMMDTLVNQSPILAYLARVASLDEMLDSEDFNGTCFAPCEEYCNKYFDLFDGHIDHLKARHIVLSSIIPVVVTKEELFMNYQIIPTLDKYNNIQLNYNFKDRQMYINTNLKIVIADIKCNKGMLHLINGLINPTTNLM